MRQKRFLSWIMVFALLVGMFTVPAYAEGNKTTITQENTSGTMNITLEIPKKTPAATDLTYTAPSDLAYSGSDKAATVAAKDSVTGMGTITVKYYSDASRTTEATPKNVGTYYVGATVAEGDQYAASTAVLYGDGWTFEITASTPDAPAVPTKASATKNSITLNEVSGCEYSKDGANWQSGTEFTGLLPGTEYTFYQRVKATANTNASVASNAKFSTEADTYAMTITLVIKPAQTITAENVTATYGDTDKSVSASVTEPTTGGGAITYAVKDGSGDYIDVAADGKLTIKKVPADGKAYVIVTAAGTDDYAETTKEVAVTISPAEVTVTAKDQSIYIGGTVPDLSSPVLGTHYTVTGLVGEDTLTTVPTLTYQKDGSAATPVNTEAGTYDIVPSGVSAGDNYTVSYANGTLTISDKGTQTITAEDVTVTYGDTDKKVSASVTDPTEGSGAISYDVKDGSGDYIGVDATTGALTIKKVPADGKAYVTVTAAGTATYEQATKDVTVTINKADPTVTAPTAKTLTYTGSAQELVNAASTNDGELRYAVTTENTAPTDEKLYTPSIPTATDAGTYYVWYKVKADENHNDTDANYVEVSIGKRSVTLTSATASKTYDGTALKYSDVTVSGDGFVTGEGATCNVTGSQILPGNTKNTFTYTLNSGTTAGNYEITMIEGTLTVTDRTDEEGDDKKYEITVIANSDEVTYDGTEKSVSGFVQTAFTFNGVTYTVSGLTATAKGTDAGSYTVEVTGTAVVKDAKGNNLTKQFIVSTSNGTLTINKRNVTLTSATASKTYDGNALTDNTVTTSGDGFATGEGATYNVTGSQKVVGSSANAFTYTLNSGTKEANYNITKTEGTLTVTSRDAKYQISPQANSDELKYDGQSHEVTGFETDTFTVEGNTYTVSGLTAAGSGTDAGSYTVSVSGTAVVKDSDGTDVSDQFSVTPQTGTLTINKRRVTMTSATDTKEYDGDALTNTEVTVTGDGFITGEGADYDVTGTRTVVGVSENTFTYTLKDNTKADNYDITTSYGTLTVNNRNTKYEVTLTANSGTEKYDGKEKTVSGYTIDGNAGEGTGESAVTSFTASNGKIYTVTGMSAEVTGTNAGEYAVNVIGTPIVKDVDGNDVTTQFAVSSESGKLTIDKRSVTLTSATDTKVYDGKALSNDEITVSEDGFVTGEGVTYNVTGTQTLPGNSKNTFDYTLKSGTTAGNYEITMIEGTLTVTDRTDEEGDDKKYEITVTANSDEVTYDGTEHSVSGFVQTAFTFNGVTYTVSGLSATAKGTDVGSYTAEVTGTAVVKDANEQ